MPVTHLFDHQIDQLVADITRLDQAGGSDSAALLRIRSTVSRELLESDSMVVTTAALGRLKSESASQRLLGIVSYCAEHFIVGSQVLSVVAFPISIRMLSLNQKQIFIRIGERGALKDLAQKIGEAVSASKVTIDTRLYQGQSLFGMKAKDIRSFLIQLADGKIYPQSGPPEFQISAEVDGPWRLAYFLGVEVMEAPRYPQLNDWPIQMRSRGWLDDAGAAIECADEILFNTEVQTEAQSHGAFYLSRALEVGTRANRALQIIETLKCLGVDGFGLNIYLTSSALGMQVRTLMVCPLLVLENKWNLQKDESVWDFQCEVERHALDLMPEFEPQTLQRIEPEEYERLALKHKAPLFRIINKAS